MSRILREWGPWLAVALAIAAVVHLGTVFALPHLIMDRTLAAMTRTLPYNTIRHGQRPSAAARGVVRPSPDLLYSSCPYDLALAHGALRVRATVPRGTYWSVSAFAANTDNFFVMNDRQVRGGTVEFLIIADGTFIHGNRLPVFVSPTNRGVVLFRTLINDEARLAEIDYDRRQALCAPYSAED